MAINLLRDRGVPLNQQRFTWHELVQAPYNKLMDDAFTRVRVILMNGIESESLRFSHACARVNGPLQRTLAQVRRVEQHQQTLVNWLNPLPQRRSMSAEYQSYSDIVPGRPTAIEHRHPLDDLRKPYDRRQAHPLTKLHALTIMAGEHQTHDYYMTIGPMFADPVARQLYAEIASIEEQHVTQYESIIDPDETWLEKWLLHEAGEVYNYWSCLEAEDNPKIPAIWERFLEYELGHVRVVAELFQEIEGRDAAEVLPNRLPEPIEYTSHREFVRETLRQEARLSARATDFVDRGEESAETRTYRDQMNSDGSPSETVAAGYVWRPGGELTDSGTRVGAAPPMTERRAA